MNSDPARLQAECGVLTTYLLGRPPSPYVVEQYLKAHLASAVDSERTRFERVLVAVARAHPRLTRLADAYARILAPRSTLRQKLVLLLAILESTPPFYRDLELAKPSGLGTTLLRLFITGVAGVLNLLAGLLILLPLHLITGALTRGARL